jgi:hypothetical protein
MAPGVDTDYPEEAEARYVSLKRAGGDAGAKTFEFCSGQGEIVLSLCTPPYRPHQHTARAGTFEYSMNRYPSYATGP